MQTTVYHNIGKHKAYIRSMRSLFNREYALEYLDCLIGKRSELPAIDGIAPRKAQQIRADLDALPLHALEYNPISGAFRNY